MKKQNFVKKRYFVKGMHCSTCETLIQQDIINIEGVTKASVSISKSHVVICTKAKNHMPSDTHLNELFEELGYTFHIDEIQDQSLQKDDIYKIIGIALLFIITFFSLERSGIFMKVSITSQSSLTSYFVFGLAAGVSSCAALIGGILLALSKKWNALYNNNTKKSILPFVYFNSSRLIAFALFGGFLGYMGSLIQVSVTLTAILTVVIAILMLIIGFQMVGIKWFNKVSFNLLGNNKYLNKNTALQGKYIPLIVGALTFFIPCGFTLIVQTNALNAGGFYLGAAQLFAFALGTLPVLILISFTSMKFYSNPAFSKRFSLFSGVIIVFFALYTLNSQLNVLGISSLNDVTFKRSDTASVTKAIQNDAGYQLIQMEAAGLEYYPKQITINSGVKTKWDIYNNGAVGCATAVYARGLYPSVIRLNPGMNSVEFVAPKPGTYKISCSMGMVSPVTVRVI